MPWESQRSSARRSRSHTPRATCCWSSSNRSFSGSRPAASPCVAWRYVQDPTLQGAISVIVPFLAYLPAYYLGASGVLATVVCGIFVGRYTPTVLLAARARSHHRFLGDGRVPAERVHLRRRRDRTSTRSLNDLHETFSPLQLTWYALAVAVTCVVVRLAWTFAQGLLPITNEPEHAGGKADWSHVAVLAWTGMRGGVSARCRTRHSV